MTMVFKIMMRQFPRILMFSISIAIGICAVLTINALSTYGIESADNTLDRLGVNGYVVSSTNVTDSDIILLSNCPCVEYISPVSEIRISGSDGIPINICGCNQSVLDMLSLDMSEGKFFDYTDVICNHDVCIISSNRAFIEYGTAECLGQFLNIVINGNTQRLTVMGVYESDKLLDTSGFNETEPIYVPYSVVNSLNASNIRSLMITTADRFDSAKTSRLISLYCDRAFGKDNYNVTDTAESRSKINSLMYTVKLILELIVSISLAVAVTGLALLMTINIYNRRKEIGLKKAIGANNRNILMETVFESTMITLTGIIEGAILFVIIKVILAFLSVNLIFDWSFFIKTLSVTVIGSASACLVPAYLAAKTEPAIALKNE